MTEQDLQQRCYTWFHNEYKELRGLLNYNYNNSHSRRQGGINKAMGLQPGRADLVFYYRGKVYNIELKTLTGKQSSTQKKWQRLIESHGFEYVIIRSLEAFQVYMVDTIKKGMLN